MHTTEPKQKDPWHLPPLGQRIIKTSLAVFLCLLVCYLRGMSGAAMSAEAPITAIICMQPYVRDSRDFALNRFAGTLIGSFWGLLFLLLLSRIPALGTHWILLYALMGVGILLSLYTAVIIRHPDTSGLAAIVFICIVIAFPDIEDPLVQAGNRFLDVFIGTSIAIVVNLFRLPRDKNRNYVFFLRTADLSPGRFSQIPSSAMFRLNYLCNDGAKICLMSEHAPAFFAVQMSDFKANIPMIMMDGAAIYDFDESQYLYVQTMPLKASEKLREKLEALDAGYFIYTVHKNKTCIFHHGKMRDPEKEVYDHMRRSPYRQYLEGEIYSPSEIVYYKLIDTEGRIADFAQHLKMELSPEEYRIAVRPQSAEKGLFAIYIYSAQATMLRAKNLLMTILKEQDPKLTEKELRLKSPYRSERDAVHLLHRVTAYYEPVKLPWRKKHGEAADAEKKHDGI